MKPQIVNAKMNKLLFKSKLVKLGIFLAVAVSIAMMTGSVYLQNSVYITDNGVTREYKTNETDIYAILRSEDYELGENDRISFTKDENNSGHITIHRAFDVSLTADGETYTYSSIGGTVSDVLSAFKIELGENDILSCDVEDELSAGMEIKVTRITYNNRQESSYIAFETEYVDNSNLTIGSETILTNGENGVHTVYYKETYVDGVLTKTEQTGEDITKQPVTEVIERGTSFAVPYAKMEDPEALKLVNGIPENYTRIVSGKSTAYSARPGSRTASGRYAVVGTVAVNPNVIPYGSELYIVAKDGSRVYGYAIAADTGTALMDGRATVDVFTASYADSCRWGAVYVDIYVLSEGKG